MDATSSAQVSMQDYFATPKSRKIATIILAAIFVGMILGAVFASQKPAVEPVQITHALDGTSTYTYLDIQLLSEWVYKVTGESSNTYYAAMDPEQSWYIVALDDDLAGQLKPYQDAYNYFFTDNAPYAETPEPYRITGMTNAISLDDISSIASFYQVTETEFSNFFGAYYLDEGTNPGNVDLALFIIGAVFAGVILLTLIAITASERKNYQRSDERLYALGKSDDAEFEFTAMDNLRFEKSKLVLSEHFAYSGSTGYIVAYEDIVWLYKRVQRNHGVVVSTQLIAGLISGRSAALAIRFVTDELIEQAVTKILRQNPNVLVGYSFDYARQYRAKVKEFKQNNR